MLTNALAFDVRVFDPGAPLFRHLPTDTMLSPGDPGWRVAYSHQDNMANGESLVGKNNTNSRVEYPCVGQGAYVDLGNGGDAVFNPPAFAPPVFATPFASSATPWFFLAQSLGDVYESNRPGHPFSQWAPGYSVYDTWSFHYENNGVNEDEFYIDKKGRWKYGGNEVDEGIDGLDSRGNYSDLIDVVRLGVDDVGERETRPPYDKPLRGVQVILRAYERDSRAIRQVRVNQHFMPE
jgi:hypothetical protein